MNFYLEYKEYIVEYMQMYDYNVDTVKTLDINDTFDLSVLFKTTEDILLICDISKELVPLRYYEFIRKKKIDDFLEQ